MAKVLDVDYLNSLKLADLKNECSSRGLHISGTKPVLIGRILDFQQTGNASASNKRSNEELKAINEQNPSKKAKNMSEAMKLLEKHKSKKWYMQALTENRIKFHEITTENLGLTPQFVLDVSGECLNIPYDSLTVEKFVEQHAVLAPKYESANFFDHKFANKDFWSKISFPNLKVLCLQQDNIKLTDEDLAAALKACPALQALDLHNNSFVGDGLENIHLTNPSLSWIWLSKSMDIYKAMPHLSKCPNLKTIVGLHLFAIDDSIVEMLVSMPKLVKCRVPYKKPLSQEPSKITPKGVAMLLLKKSFDLQDFPASTLVATASTDTTEFKPKGPLSMEDLKNYLTKCPNLKKIDLEMCKFSGDINKALAEIAQAPCAAKIEDINLTGYQEIRNEGLKELGKLRALRTLALGFAWQGSFGDAANLSQDLFVKTSENWKELRKLEIQFSPITTNSLMEVLHNCPNLAVVDMTGCGGETDDFVTMHYDLAELKRKGVHIIHEKQ
eukprot:Phypoly_transcript_07724.p1 GENE.Phypoly_transcript_07724~~Phypoly_transcript_07724.p1  ORF type:complete len:515 (-),score=86.78 Phypoly_transcript_07724:59-1555(-)